MKTLILAGLIAVTALSAAQPAAAIIIRPPQGCGMTALCGPHLPKPPPIIRECLKCRYQGPN